MKILLIVLLLASTGYCHLKLPQDVAKTVADAFSTLRDGKNVSDALARASKALRPYNINIGDVVRQFQRSLPMMNLEGANDAMKCFEGVDICQSCGTLMKAWDSCCAGTMTPFKGGFDINLGEIRKRGDNFFDAVAKEQQVDSKTHTMMSCLQQSWDKIFPQARQTTS